MRKITVVLLFLFLLPCSSEAAFKDQKKGYPLSESGSVISAEAASKLPDDTRITLRGHIVKHLYSDHYLFRDASGEIKLEIDDDVWKNLVVTPEDLLEIYGEVDKGLTGTEIEVDHVRKIEKTFRKFPSLEEGKTQTSGNV